MSYPQYDLVCIMDKLYHIPGTNITQGDLADVVEMCKAKPRRVEQFNRGYRRYYNQPLSRPKPLKRPAQSYNKKNKIRDIEHFGFNNQCINFLLIVLVVIFVLNYVN